MVVAVRRTCVGRCREERARFPGARLVLASAMHLRRFSPSTAPSVSWGGSEASLPDTTGPGAGSAAAADALEGATEGGECAEP